MFFNWTSPFWTGCVTKGLGSCCKRKAERTGDVQMWEKKAQERPEFSLLQDLRGGCKAGGDPLLNSAPCVGGDFGVVCQGCDSGGPGWADTLHNSTIPSPSAPLEQQDLPTARGGGHHLHPWTLSAAVTPWGPSWAELADGRTASSPCFLCGDRIKHLLLSPHAEWSH